MWSKISHALKPRPATPGLDESDLEPDVLASVLQQHPNMSIFHTESEVPFPSPSPPASPTRNGRRGLLKRMAKAARDEADTATMPIKLPITLPKKVKSSLQSVSTGSESSLSRASTDSPSRPSEDTARQPRQSNDSNRPPLTPLNIDSKFSSLRSILRPGNTPGTGQSVRFFSRDAYKFISPENSSSEQEDVCFEKRMQQAMTPSRPAVQDIFSPSKLQVVSTPAAAAPIPMSPPHGSNIFDLSQDAELPDIPAGFDVPLLDSAIEISEPETETEDPIVHEVPEPTLTPLREPVFRPPGHDRSQSFSFGQTVFHSMAAESSPAGDQRTHTPNRSRAMSDTMFHSMSIASPPPTSSPSEQPPEADINDTSGGALVAYTSSEREKDPFGAYATTYYTPGTMATTPPAPVHARKASREEDLIWSLRTQLALQSELCAQYEVDLSARDEVVQVLTNRLSDSEKECERRKGVIRSWRKKVSELEKCVRGLEEEVERSREESMDRSVMDEASGQALRVLQRRIAELEREKSDSEKREHKMTEEMEAQKAALTKAREELRKRDQSELELKEGIKAAKEQMEQMGEQTTHFHQDEDTKALIAKTEQLTMEERESHRAAASAWTEERAKLTSLNESLRNDQMQLQSQLNSVREELMSQEAELKMLQAELEAQWQHTEQAGEKIQTLETEKETLQGEVDALNERISNMEMDWNDGENRKNELENELQDTWAVKEQAEREREELRREVRAEQQHAEELTQALQEREDRVAEQQREHQYVLDNMARLEENIRRRNAEVADYHQQLMERENKTEQQAEEITKIKREHAKTVNEQSRQLQDVVAREVEARAKMEALVKEKAESGVLLATLKERVSALDEEVERLRRQIHDLKQESADREVKLAQAAKQKQQDKDDIQGLNIALDSKQQELELLKRRIGVRGTAGTTPSQAAKAPHHRRESSIFGTPSVSRPSSSLSDVASLKDRKLETPASAKPPQTPSTIKAGQTLSKSVRANGSSLVSRRSVEGSMGPPPAKARASVGPPSAATRIPSGSSISSLTRPSSVTPAKGTVHRRASSSTLEPSRLKSSITPRDAGGEYSSGISEQSEKENSTPPQKARRMSAMPA